MSLYLDASVIVTTVVREPASRAVIQFLEGLSDRPIVSELAAVETASAVSRLVRMDRVSGAAAAARLAEFDAWRAGFTVGLDIQPADVALAGAMVRRFELGLRAPDALHAAACQSGGHTLVTLDRRLAWAAESLGVLTHRLGQDA
ncbi:MAG TPA: type II toxin-antitoxin system VapC family toxin [Caulobacteraceae bacterium]